MESNFSVDRAHDYLFIAFVVQKLNGTLDKDGAAHLNNLLQQRADLTKEQAFAFIKDAISSNLIYVEKEGDSRKLRVNQTTFNVLRDKYGDLIPQIHSNIESSKWKFRSAIRFQLSDDERQSLNKFISQNRVKDGPAEAKKVEPVVDDKKERENLVQAIQEDFQEIVGERLVEFVKLHSGKDFSILIKKTGDKIDCSIRDVKDQKNIVWAWS
jgi:hypothetical protein